MCCVVHILGLAEPQTPVSAVVPSHSAMVAGSMQMRPLPLIVGDALEMLGIMPSGSFMNDLVGAEQVLGLGANDLSVLERVRALALSLSINMMLAAEDNAFLTPASHGASSSGVWPASGATCFSHVSLAGLPSHFLSPA